ncbi:PREDICTED: uncharacterized protein LOC109584098 [Amphimedon queenslandica]|uniref:DED domain-containing protein n=1 Tax=Amphimedon queenslandica TaxID=400682 RepID=A0A1X7UAT9_AMPQE|nr:PREDICTED: uncharacterized protein LOC109584098 [Amphimedon queenslandica]|eukprot:XP_019855247.1 PREDICTED: uncharacterized protein LOC109584098 [Amphimedon queenslandica]
MATHHQSEQGDEMYWPTTPRSKDAELYKDYKKLLAGIAEEMQKADVIALAYMFDLPKWYSEVGATKETSYAARVLSFIEGRNIISPDSLGPLATSLEEIGRMDLKRKIDAFENRHRNRVMKKPTEETCANISDKIDEEEEDYEQFGRVDARRSYNQRRRNVVRSSSDRYPSSMWLSAPYKTTSITGTIPVTQQYTTGGSYMPNRPIIHSPPSFSSPPPQSDLDSMEVHVSMESDMHQVNDPRQKYIQPQSASRKNEHRIWGSMPPKDRDNRSERTLFKLEQFDSVPQPSPSQHLDPDARSIHLSIRTTTMTAKALKKQIEFLRERLGGSYPYLDKQLQQADNCTKETLDVLKLLARETRNQSREEEEEEDVLLYKGTTHQRNPAQRHKRYYSEGFHEGAPPVAFQRCNTQPEGTGYKISLSIDESDLDDEIQSPTGVSDELPEDIVSVEAVISPEFVSSKSRKVSAPVRSPPPPLVTSSARLSVKAESIGNINKTDGASTHSGRAKGKQKISVQPSKSMSSLDEASPAKQSTGKKKMWPLKIFRSQKNL